MPAQNKVGTQLLVSPHIKADGQALALVRQEAVAEVWRLLLEQALPGMKQAHASALHKLYATLDVMGVDRNEALQAMVDQRMVPADLYLADGSPRSRFPGKLPAKAA